MKRVLWAILLTTFAFPALAQDVKRADIVGAYDLDATSFTYCVATGANGDPWGAPIESKYPLKTSGSSTTVVEAVTDSLPFSLLSVGDILYIYNDTSDTAAVIRYITAKASGASITVNAAIDAENGGNGRKFYWKKVSCGTGADNGWVTTTGWLFKKVSVHLNQMNATSIDIKWECRDNSLDTNPVNVYPGTQTSGVCPGGTVVSNACNYTAAGQNTRTDLEIDVPYDACRVGFKVNTDDGNDAGANAESITAFVKVWGAK